MQIHFYKRLYLNTLETRELLHGSLPIYDIYSDVVAANTTVEIPVAFELTGTFYVALRDGNLDFQYELLGPNGELVNPAVAAISPDYDYVEADPLINPNLEAGFSAFRFNSGTSGQWTLRVTNPTSSTGYLQAQYASGGAFAAMNSRLEKDFILPGQSNLLESWVSELGFVLSSGTQVANVYNSHHQLVGEFPLNDQGLNGDITANDGIYSFNLGNGDISPGAYFVFIVGEATTPYPYVVGSAQFFAKSDGSARVVQVLNDQAVDLDNDGLFDKFYLDVQVDVREAGLYTIYGNLNKDMLTFGGFGDRLQLQPGLQTIRFTVDGEVFALAGVDGPYNIQQLVINRLPEIGDYIPVDRWQGSYSTQSYTPDQFSFRPALVTGASAYGNDTNENGLFETLNIGIDADIRVAGNYTWTAQLQTNNGTPIQTVTFTGDLSAGIQSLPLSITAQTIRDFGYEGEFLIANVQLTLNSTAETFVYPFGQFTLPFELAQFEDHQMIVMGSESGSTVQLIESRSNTEMQRFNPFADQRGYRGAVRVAVGDFDGDGIEEFAAAQGPGGTGLVRVFKMDGTLHAMNRNLRPFGSSRLWNTQISAADLNGDGKDELVAVGQASGVTRMRTYNLQTGSLLGGTTNLPAFLAGSTRIAVGDLNNDGSDDIVVSGLFRGKVQIHARSGSNNAVLPVTMPLVPSPGLVPTTFTRTLQGVRVTIADFDNDGKNDIALALMARNQAPYVGIMQNQGMVDDKLTFVPVNEMRMSQPVTSLEIGARDINRDGKADLLTSMAFSNNTSMLRGMNILSGESFFSHSLSGRRNGTMAIV